MRYTIQSLIEYCNDKNIILSKDYTTEKIARESYIEGNCIIEGCCLKFNKNFRQLVKTGSYCKDCMTTIANNKIKQSNLIFDINKLNEFCNNNKIILSEEYSNASINRNTVIKGNCLYTGCENIFEKSFRQLLKINGYCKNCSKENGKEKIKNTNLIKYGVSYPSQNAEIAETMLTNSYNKKQYKFPSGKIICYQGYENYGLDELLYVEKICEDDIITNRNICS